MRKCLVLAALLCAFTRSVAQEQKPLAEAGVVECVSPTPASSMSPWVKSPAGYLAAVELRQRITGTGSHRVCRTNWLLHVRKEGEKPRTIEVAEDDASPDSGEWNQENSFELEAWSTDGNLLLAAQIEAAGDASDTTPIIYDFNSSSYRRIDLRPVFGQLTPADCYVVFYPLRFDASGSLVIRALSTDDDRDPGTPACFPESDWRYDLRTNTISHIRPSPKAPPLLPSPLPNVVLPVPPKPPN